MSIQAIPCEVLERVFSFLDGRSFSVCAQVCTFWRDIYEDMVRVKDWWKVFCFKEIPRDSIQELCGDNSVYKDSVHHQNVMYVNWKTIYKQWFTCRRTTFKVCQVNKFSSVESAPVTCCKLSGRWVLTGHRNGSICAWNLPDGEMIRIVTQHLRMVTDFVLVDLLGIGPYRGTFHESTCGHQFAISVSKDHNIQISSLLEDSYGLYFESQVIKKHSDTLESVRLFGDRFAVLCSNNTISVWLLLPHENPCDVPKVILQYFLTGPGEQAAWISFWNNQIGCLCKSGVFKVFDLHLETWGAPLQPEVLCVGDADHTFNDNYSLVISNAHIFWNTVIFLITADFHLWLSTCGSTYTIYPTIEKFHSYVLSLCFCGPLLALGLENGTLVLFYVNSSLHMLDQSLQNPVWQKRLSPASIIAIDILLQESGPLVVAATTHSWITVDWSGINADTSDS